MEARKMEIDREGGRGLRRDKVGSKEWGDGWYNAVEHKWNHLHTESEKRQNTKENKYREKGRPGKWFYQK